MIAGAVYGLWVSVHHASQETKVDNLSDKNEGKNPARDHDQSFASHTQQGREDRDVIPFRTQNSSNDGELMAKHIETKRYILMARDNSSASQTRGPRRIKNENVATFTLNASDAMEDAQS